MYVTYVDCVGCRTKNLQKIRSIEIFFTVYNDLNFVIEYEFHETDFDLWKKIVEIHTDNVKEYKIILNEKEVKIEDIINNMTYYSIKIKSLDVNLYKNINLILMESDDDLNKKSIEGIW